MSKAVAKGQEYYATELHTEGNKRCGQKECSADAILSYHVGGLG